VRYLSDSHRHNSNSIRSDLFEFSPNPITTRILSVLNEDSKDSHIQISVKFSIAGVLGFLFRTDRERDASGTKQFKLSLRTESKVRFNGDKDFFFTRRLFHADAGPG
jgi:hypothetical protein